MIAAFHSVWLAKVSSASHNVSREPVDGIQCTQHVGVKCVDTIPIHRKNWLSGAYYTK